VTIIDATSGRAIVLPTVPRIKLWRDALEGMGVEVSALARNRGEQNKYIYPVPNCDAGRGPLPELQRLYIVNNTNVMPARPEATRREEMLVPTLLSLIAMPRALKALNAGRRAGVIARAPVQHVPVHQRHLLLRREEPSS